MTRRAVFGVPEFRRKIAKAATPFYLQRLLEIAQRRVAAGETIGLPSLSQSWQADADAIEDRLAAVGPT